MMHGTVRPDRSHAASLGRALALVLLCLAGVARAASCDYAIRPCAAASLDRGFWFDRLETNRTATLKSNWAKCFETPRIANFTNAAARATGTFGGIPFDDSDVFKVMEGTAYILASRPDAALERRMRWLVGEIAKAQEPDGYLYTARTLGHHCLGDRKGWERTMMGPVRWSALEHSHELYNLGHMYEAAVAWHEATGRRDFLDVAIRSADLVDRTFGPGATQLKGVPGHEEIELALVRLYRATGERRYLDLARFFLDRRGFGVKTRAGKVFAQDGSLVEAGNAAGNYSQQHMPVREQREAVGHAVRANYLYCGMADVAALTGDKGLLDAIDAIWEDVVSRKLHINGGCGARPEGEAYGAAYELPNDYGETYLETCAAIANALWNERMFRLHGEAKYIDVLERTIYNGFLSGISLSGDEYFYPNPLASKGGYSRSKWFNCSCCPVNDLRFVPQIPAFAFASKKGVVYWNLFMSGQARIGYGATAAEGPFVRVRQTTDYPWSGRAELVVLGPDAESNGDWRGTFALKVRIPLWARGKPVPGDLYVQTVPASVSEVSLSVDGRAVEVSPGVDGYVEISREWKAGDRVVLELPLDVKRIKAHDNVAADRGRLAVERGPILYCAEGVDNGGKAYDARIPAGAAFEDAQIAIGDKSFPALKSSNGVVLVPYCLWGNREKGGELQTWF